jgi:uncharacterized surface protein with fasciclin (FAS1) repeats
MIKYLRGVPTRQRRFVIGSLLIPLFLTYCMAACGQSEQTTAGREVEFSGGDYVTTLKETGLTSAFAQIVEAAWAELALDSTKSYTLFAPTDEAVTDALDASSRTLDELVRSPKLATAFVREHLVEGSLTATNLLNVGDSGIRVLTGRQIAFENQEDGLRVTSSGLVPAKVIAIDIASSNGTVHLVDRVLAEPSQQ